MLISRNLKDKYQLIKKITHFLITKQIYVFILEKFNVMNNFPTYIHKASYICIIIELKILDFNRELTRQYTYNLGQGLKYCLFLVTKVLFAKFQPVISIFMTKRYNNPAILQVHYHFTKQNTKKTSITITFCFK